MLEALRRGTSKILATLLFVVLIASFALWGIPNYTRDFSQSTLAKVGDAKLTEEEYKRFFDSHLNIFSQQAGQRLTRENARLAYRIQQIQQGNFSADLDREILNLQVGQAVIDQQAKAMGLGIPDSAVVEAIRSDPAFQGPDKQFNRTIFESRVREAGLSEIGYIRDRKANEIREQITESVVAGVGPSDTLVAIAHKFREEARTVAAITLDATKVPKPADPDEAKLKEFYEASKSQFKAPELRSFSALILSREDVKDRAKIEDADVKATWERDQQAWNIPERRRIQQIVFKSKDAAQAVGKEISGGAKSFLLAALEENGAQGRLDQGLLSRSGIPDQKIANAVFTLPLNQLSEPIEARNGTVVLRVTEIQPGRVRPFDEVAKEIREDLEQKKQREISTRLHDQIEDLRGAGKTLKFIADDVKLKLIDVKDAPRTGLGGDGKPVLELPEAGRVVASAFEGAKELPRDPVEMQDGTEAWVEVTGISPERVKAFEEVKDDAKKSWIEAEGRKALTAAAQALVDRMKAGETFEAVAKSQGLKVEMLPPFKRGAPAAGLSVAAARQAFTLPKGGYAAADTSDSKSRLIFVVTDIKTPEAPAKEEAERLKQSLRQQFQGDARNVLVGALRNRIGVSIDETAYKRIVGEQPQR